MNNLYVCVIDVVWNNPPKKPIPVKRREIYRLKYSDKHAKIIDICAILVKSMDLSRLMVTALDNNIYIREILSIRPTGFEPI